MGDRDIFINIARKYVGTTEQPEGSNRGPLIDEWNRQVGVPVGSFWCASFVSEVAKQWSHEVGDYFPLPLSASCDHWLSSAKQHNLLSDTPGRASIGLVINPKNSSDATHIFIVEGFKDGVWSSIEGNSNSGGSRNGTSVARRANCMAGRSRLKFIEWYEGDDPEIPWHLSLNVGGAKKAVQLHTISNSTYLPVRSTLKELGLDTSLLKYDGQPTYNGIKLKDVLVLNGSTHMKVRTFCELFGLPFTIDKATKVITVNEKTSWL
jgi:hypothetical protein